MGEAKRRAVENRRMAARIDERIKQLDASGMQEAEILLAMEEYMADFRHVMVHASGREMDALCGEFAGFYRFAKILETLASGIASGEIKVPGDRATKEERRLAAAIDQRVRQLEAAGVRGGALLERMVGSLPDLHRIWSATSDETLALLLSEYPGLYRYGLLMEEAAEAESKKTTTSYGCLSPLPDSAKATVTRLLANGAEPERGLQTVLDADGQKDMRTETEIFNEMRDEWKAQLAGLPGALRAANVPQETDAMLMRIFDPIARRIDQLHGQVAAKRS